MVVFPAPSNPATEIDTSLSDDNQLKLDFRPNNYVHFFPFFTQ